ncbi:MAG TPA: hypothetical protein VF041_23185 [Gemmatimonadaceae bacterium]
MASRESFRSRRRQPHNGEKRRVTITWPAELVEVVERRAAAAGISLSYELRQLVERCLPLLERAEAGEAPADHDPSACC